MKTVIWWTTLTPRYSYDFCTKLCHQVGVKSTPWWKISHSNSSGPLPTNRNLLFAGKYQPHLGYEIVKLGVKPAPCRLSPIPWFSLSPKSRFSNRLETYSNWKGKMSLVASRWEHFTYRPKHVFSNSKGSSIHFGNCQRFSTRITPMFYEPILLCDSISMCFHTRTSFISKPLHNLHVYRNQKRY